MPPHSEHRFPALSSKEGRLSSTSTWSLGCPFSGVTSCGRQFWRKVPESVALIAAAKFHRKGWGLVAMFFKGTETLQLSQFLSSILSQFLSGVIPDVTLRV